MGHIPPHGEGAARRVRDEAGPRADIALLGGTGVIITITITIISRGVDVEVVINPTSRVLTQPGMR